jgi:hypothetical protein
MEALVFVLEFMATLEPPIKPSTKAVINETFDKLDITKDDILDVEDMRGEVDYCITFTYVDIQCNRNGQMSVFF